MPTLSLRTKTAPSNSYKAAVTACSSVALHFIGLPVLAARKSPLQVGFFIQLVAHCKRAFSFNESPAASGLREEAATGLPTAP